MWEKSVVTGSCTAFQNDWSFTLQSLLVMISVKLITLALITKRRRPKYSKRWIHQNKNHLLTFKNLKIYQKFIVHSSSRKRTILLFQKHFFSRKLLEKLRAYVWGISPWNSTLDDEFHRCTYLHNVNKVSHIKSLVFQNKITT